MVMVEVRIPIAISDLQLAQMARSDPNAKENLLRRVYPKIFQIARFAAGSRRQADDIAQIAAMEVLKSLDTFGGTGSIESWVGRITYRVAMKTLKKEQWIENMFFPLSEDILPSSENPEMTASKRQLFDRLVSKMARIPAKRRIPLLLRLVYGYKVSEVAELTEVSPNTVKDRLKTAYRELRTILDEHPNLRAAMLEEIS
jgi:RNA polymerase sigma-70 factor (ECF subfamily)